MSGDQTRAAEATSNGFATTWPAPDGAGDAAALAAVAAGEVAALALAIVDPLGAADDDGAGLPELAAEATTPGLGEAPGTAVEPAIGVAMTTAVSASAATRPTISPAM